MEAICSIIVQECNPHHKEFCHHELMRASHILPDIHLSCAAFAGILMSDACEKKQKQKRPHSPFSDTDFAGFSGTAIHHNHKTQRCHGGCPSFGSRMSETSQE